MTESDLLAGLRNGEEPAFDAIFRAHYAGLVRFAESILGDRGAAEEICQDVLLELWRRRESIRVETSLQSYLFRAARNRALNAVRHDNVVRREGAAIAAASPTVPRADEATYHAEMDRAVEAAVATLPPRCREIFELSRFHGLTYNEIAVAMGISAKTVEAQMGKALRVLRDRLAPWLAVESPM